MLKSITKTLLLLLFMTVAAKAQWTNVGPFPDASLLGQAHALATDPDGKIWVGNFGTESYAKAPGDTVKGVRLIRVFNPDGTQASFSPIYVWDNGTTKDTLKGSNTRGMRDDADGNILVVDGNQNMYKFDYKTGKGLAKVALALGTSPTAPAVASDGTIFVGPVVPGNPIKMFDKDFNYLGNALEATVGYSRSFEVSKDGLKIYWAGYSNGEVRVFSRPDAFSAFDTLYTPILVGAKSESMTWQPGTGLLWVAGGSYADVPTAPFTPGTWYGYDVNTNAVVDSMALVFTVPADAGQRPRALGFSPDGNTAYIGCFGGSGYPLVQKLVKGAPSSVSVTFNVNMSIAEAKGTFNPASDKVHLAGNFNGWNNSATELSDNDGDKIYSVKIDTFKAGQSLSFKFIRNTDGWENDPNRTYTVPGSNSSYTAYFNNDSVAATKEIDVTFAADMTYEIASGRFNVLTDTLSARGSFNGWSSSDIMYASVSNPNVYEVTKKISTYAGETFNYKFAYITSAGINWEGDPNKTYTVTADDIKNGFAYAQRVYNNLSDTAFVRQNCTIKFTVYMGGAISSYSGTAFPSIDNVIIAGANPPLKWPAGGWPNADVNLVLQMYNDGTNGDDIAGDQIWSRNITFSKYSPLKIQYKYGANYGLSTNTGSNDNESSTGTDHFIYMKPEMTASAVHNFWGVMGTIDITGVEKVDNQLPVSYSLEQNFPNPFNPSTTIRFSVPEEGLVTMKVFNILGQEMATLVNEVKTAGNFAVSFDASKLSSGTYFYTISTKNYTATKKMMLVK